MPKGIDKGHDVVGKEAPALESGYNNHDNPGIMPRKGAADTPGSDTNTTLPVETTAGVPKQKPIGDHFGG